MSGVLSSLVAVRTPDIVRMKIIISLYLYSACQWVIYLFLGVSVSTDFLENMATRRYESV